jgi:GT2 family glycosyltransferase
MPRVFALVLNYNAADHLPRVIESLRHQDFQNLGILIVDNASTDGSVEVLHRLLSPEEVMFCTENTGYGGGFNAGLRQLSSRSDYIMLMNPDMVPASNWASRAVAHLDANPRTDMISGLTLTDDGETIECMGGSVYSFPLGLMGGYLGTRRSAECAIELAVASVSTIFVLGNPMMIRSASLARSGMFDESYFMYFEDIDLSWRTLLAGGNIEALPSLVCRHKGHASKRSRELDYRIARAPETNLLLTYHKILNSRHFWGWLPFLLLTRGLLALTYLAIDPRLTTSKLAGLSEGLHRIICDPHQREWRRKVQSTRIREDHFLFERNRRVRYLSVGSTWTIASSWFRNMFRTFGRRRPSMR